jgi:transcriptional regulator with XRE-family HTH domain
MTMIQVEYADDSVVGRPARRLPALRRLREQRALSQDELAKSAELSRATVVSLETGKAGAQYATIRKLAKALDVELAELMDEGTA